MSTRRLRSDGRRGTDQWNDRTGTPDGSTREVADNVWFPNGMAVTPDNSTLIAAESYRNRLTAFDIDAHGDLSPATPELGV